MQISKNLCALGEIALSCMEKLSQIKKSSQHRSPSENIFPNIKFAARICKKTPPQIQKNTLYAPKAKRIFAFKTIAVGPRQILSAAAAQNYEPGWVAGIAASSGGILSASYVGKENSRRAPARHFKFCLAVAPINKHCNPCWNSPAGLYDVYALLHAASARYDVFNY